jgi:hypothetical protein
LGALSAQDLECPESGLGTAAGSAVTPVEAMINT